MFPKPLAFAASALLILLFAACEKQSTDDQVREADGPILPGETVVQLVQSEDLVLDLTPQLSQLAQALRNSGGFELPDVLAATVLEESPLRKLRPVGDVEGILLAKLAFKTETASGAREPWASFNSIVSDWQSAKFGVKSAKFATDRDDLFDINAVFSGRAKGKNGELFGVRALQNVRFGKTANQWNIVGWSQERFAITKLKTSLFTNVTKEAVPDPRTNRAIIRSVHEEYLVNVVKTGVTPVYDKKYLPFVDADMNHATPSISVVDLNDDGWDDLFVTARWSPPIFLQNNGDGTFVDKTKQIGIIARGMVNCSCFVDIDNDGDKDVILGRALEPVVVMENQNGKFKDVTAKQSNLNRLFFVSAISASDINQDGLVDFYLSTYGPAGDNRGVDWKRMFLPRQQSAVLAAKEKSDHMWVDFPGPPNVVVMNRGNGRLEMLPVDQLVSQWHNSFQSVWGDFDLDGDDDLYVCNDFAPGGFLVNETEPGAANPEFRDGIPRAFPKGTMGFGMGASWSDFDADGDLDLYVSNMYSKAGKRILAQLANNDRRFEVSATGNFLYRNNHGEFDQVAGPGNDQLPVHQVGWSYGGQFADFNNDGFSDLYVPSGFFTAPEVGQTTVDL